MPLDLSFQLNGHFHRTVKMTKRVKLRRDSLIYFGARASVLSLRSHRCQCDCQHSKTDHQLGLWKLDMGLNYCDPLLP